MHQFVHHEHPEERTRTILNIKRPHDIAVNTQKPPSAVLLLSNCSWRVQFGVTNIAVQENRLDRRAGALSSIDAIKQKRHDVAAGNYAPRNIYRNR